jgi:hypothetical protein
MVYNSPEPGKKKKKITRQKSVLPFLPFQSQLSRHLCQPVGRTHDSYPYSLMINGKSNIATVGPPGEVCIAQGVSGHPVIQFQEGTVGHWACPSERTETTLPPGLGRNPNNTGCYYHL